MIILLLAIVLLHLRDVPCQNVNVKEFCDTKCLNPKDTHTICQYKCEIGPDCKDWKLYPFADKDRQTLLDEHNKYREKVASGGDSRGGNGAAKDMIALNYDVDIEVTSFCWSRRCLFKHDVCRNLPKYTSAGQNLFLQSGTLPISGANTKLLNTSVYEWYEEIKDTKKAYIDKFQKVEGKMIGHFTQLVWATTEFMGCTRVTYTDPKELKFKFHYHLLCNYSPSGNFLEAPVYLFGKGCTERKANDHYKSLCGEVKPVITTSDPPYASGKSRRRPKPGPQNMEDQSSANRFRHRNPLILFIYCILCKVSFNLLTIFF